MNEIVLDGCAPTPLAGYLKALGVLRLLSTQYPETRGFWRGDRFVLCTSLDREGIERFFLEDYAPTPVMAPWNAGSGFYYQERKGKEIDPATGKKKKLGIRDQPTAATKTIDAMLATTGSCFESYRQALKLCRATLIQSDLAEAPKNGAPKDSLVLKLRTSLSDECLDWLDAALLISAGSTQFPPLLGTGGNDGNLDFTNNFMQRLLDVIGPAQEQVSSRWLVTALFSKPAPNHVKSAIGQFSPGQAGGPNSTAGFDADASINPWDFVLMIEGALPFAAAAVRRNADDPAGLMSYPFTVRAVGAGSGSLGEGDTASARGELWMPLWAQAAAFPEVRALLAEGRVSLNGKPVRDALDFVRAVHHLGVYRGISEFQRFGLLMRSGKAYLATPLSRVVVSNGPTANWLDDLDQRQWLDRFRRYCRGANTANRFVMLRKRLEDRLFALAGREPSKAEAQAMLVLLGEVQAALSASPKACEEVPPIPRLSEQWLAAADDDSAAFRIAKALAGLKGSAEQPLPLRAQLFPVERKRSRWMSPESGEKQRIHTGQRGRLIDALRSLLNRRLLLAEPLEIHDKPLDSRAGATLADIAAFLRDDRMDARIAELLPGLVLCAIPQDLDHSGGDAVVPAAFALLKLCVTPDRILSSPTLKLLPEDARLPVPPGMLAQLAAGNHGNRALQVAWRRLRASGLAPVFTVNSLPAHDSIDPQRTAAALLIPLRFGATAALARSVLKQAEPEANLETA